jgi:hypothetical protein
LHCVELTGGTREGVANFAILPHRIDRRNEVTPQKAADCQHTEPLLVRPNNFAGTADDLRSIRSQEIKSSNFVLG